MAKKYKCPYCSFHGTKEDLIEHVDDKHEEMIPEGFSAGRTVFNYINKKTSGVCVVCKRPTEWNEKRLKYNRLCGRKECVKALRDTYSKNMIKVHGTDNLLNDPDQQELMLKNRKISGKYKFSDGGYHIYTGSYEHKTLEFLDKVLGYKSTEILSPGPILDYEYAGKHLKWITDIYIIPYNLIIEVKDGGNNKNNREMISYREKQIAKENAIIKLGKFNYLRLTNNNFEQLLEILMQLKMQMIDTSEEDRKPLININEEVLYLQEESKNSYPLYIVLTYTDDIVNKTISKFTKGHWGHIGISFNETLDSIYTFSMNINHPHFGFNIEDLEFYKKILVDEIVVFEANVSKEKYELIKSKIKFYKDNMNNTSYNIQNFISNMNKVKNENELSMICSGFVDMICGIGEIKYTKGSYSTVNPNQIYKVMSHHKDVFKKIYRGSINNYMKEE